ncbi:GntR family transcriptional repressor for pyruvate dehydrogenase complex [Catenulispora sp. GP43]|uniref:FadR/GntR family transcriptional regulator n=1 Tax=Catenulispora sp. GP43 TaxID=3156263 RepID=UPI0035141835
MVSTVADVQGYSLFQPVRTGNAFEDTIERILRVIKLGEVPIGDRLPPERELAELLNVSRDTVREALKVLSAEGIVESRRGRAGGAYVLRTPAPPGHLREAVDRLPNGLEDTLVFRHAVEGGAAEAAAARTLDAEMRALLVTRMKAAESADIAAYRIADTRYHLAVAELSGSPQLAAAVADARLRINDLLESIPMMSVNLRHAAHQHERITTAVLGGDPEGARRAMLEHLDGTAMLLRGFLD